MEDDTKEAFIKWLYNNYRICNGDMLIQLEENGYVIGKYLQEMGLPEDAELK